MSTRCRIGIKNKDDTVSSVYCHFDGYIKGVGKTLLEHYKTEDRIRTLLSLGDISSLGTEPIENPTAWVEIDPLDGIAWFDAFEVNHPKDRCDLYRTRGDTNIDAEVDECLAAYRTKVCDSWCDYGYFFCDGDWYVFTTFGKDAGKPELLSEALKKEEENKE